MNWQKLKSEVELLLQTAPQRAAQASHAIQQIEAGFAELAKVGYSFEPQVKGLVAAVEEQQPTPQTRPMSIDDAMAVVKRPQNPSMVVSGGSEIFEERPSAQ